jgi:hypothetical protein
MNNYLIFDTSLQSGGSSVGVGNELGAPKQIKGEFD